MSVWLLAAVGAGFWLVAAAGMGVLIGECIHHPDAGYTLLGRVEDLAVSA